MYKVGDRLLCKTSNVIAAGITLSSKYYTKDKYYTVVDIYDDQILVIENNQAGIVQSFRNVFFFNEVREQFYTIKEVRRMKLSCIK